MIIDKISSSYYFLFNILIDLKAYKEFVEKKSCGEKMGNAKPFVRILFFLNIKRGCILKLYTLKKSIIVLVNFVLNRHIFYIFNFK